MKFYSLAAAVLLAIAPAIATGQIQVTTQRPGLLGGLCGRGTTTTISGLPANGLHFRDVVNFQLELHELQALQRIGNETERIGDQFDRFNQQFEMVALYRAGVELPTVPTMAANPMGPQVQCPTGGCPPVRVYAPPVRSSSGKPKATVRVRSSLKGYNRIGSGCHIGGGLILTCAHILRHGWAPTIETTDGRRFKAKIIRADALRDLSVLKIDDPAFDALYVPVGQRDPGPNEAANLSGMSAGHRIWPGRVVGYFGPDIQVVGAGTREGDSGGPIVVGGKVVSVINEYIPAENKNVGPCVRDVRRFLSEAGIADPPK